MGVVQATSAGGARRVRGNAHQMRTQGSVYQCHRCHLSCNCQHFPTAATRAYSSGTPPVANEKWYPRRGARHGWRALASHDRRRRRDLIRLQLRSVAVQINAIPCAGPPSRVPPKPPQIRRTHCSTRRSRSTPSPPRACRPRARTAATAIHARRPWSRSTLDWAGASTRKVRAFHSEAGSCATAAASHWVGEPASDHRWVTAHDGDAVLTTTEDGSFTRE
jgi:hypothetical protein